MSTSFVRAVRRERREDTLCSQDRQGYIASGRENRAAGAQRAFPGRDAAGSEGPAVSAATSAAPSLAPADQAEGAAPAGGIPGLRGLDHVVIGVNDLIGAATAYERLGFEVVRVNHPQDAPAAAFVDLGTGYLELVPPESDTLGQPAPYTFEGALAQAWEVADLEAALEALGRGGAEFGEPRATDLAPRAAGSVIRRASPVSEPVSGSTIFLVDYDEAALRTAWDRAVEAGAKADPLDHPNGAASLEYVTIALRSPQGTIEALDRWGLDPAAPEHDARGAQTSEVELGEGRLYLTVPAGGGGLDDFLEERRALAPPVGDRYFEGGILSVGVGVADLGVTETFFQDHQVPYIPMDLAAGRTLVVQGAPGWSLRLEFVQAGPAETRTGWAAHRAAGGASPGPAGADAR